MSSSQDLYVFENPFTKFLLKYFSWHLLHFKHLNINNLCLASTYSRQDLQSLNLLYCEVLQSDYYYLLLFITYH